MTKYLYFSPHGKYKYEGEGKSIPKELWPETITHDMLWELNDNSMPGITGNGKDYFIIIVDEESWPRLIYPANMEPLHTIFNHSFNLHSMAYRESMTNLREDPV